MEPVLVTSASFIMVLTSLSFGCIPGRLMNGMTWLIMIEKMMMMEEKERGGEPNSWRSFLLWGSQSRVCLSSAYQRAQTLPDTQRSAPDSRIPVTSNQSINQSIKGRKVTKRTKKKERILETILFGLASEKQWVWCVVVEWKQQTNSTLLCCVVFVCRVDDDVCVPSLVSGRGPWTPIDYEISLDHRNEPIAIGLY